MKSETAAPADEIRIEKLPDDIAPPEPLIELPDGPGDAVLELERALGLHPLAAQTMVRRGFTDGAAAREWLEGMELQPPDALPGAVEAAQAIARHLRADSRIAVHGDYDVDGVCSTAIMVRTLSNLGADVTWHVPSRFEDGYGLSNRAIERLADDGARLIITVDCGVGSIAEVDHARSLGVDVVICDHHSFGDRLPEAPVAHPGLGGYVCPELCAAATTYKVAQVLTATVGGDPESLRGELELVALATVCDVVPLHSENRALVRHGIELMRRTLRPGLRELMRVAGVDQLKLDAGSFGYALGPRINAAGRMFSAEPAVELMLTTNEARAAELAEDLNGSNARRREIEQKVLFDAETQARAQRDRFAIVVAGEGWHPGVLGIVAGRIAEQFRRPAIALAIENGVASGSGRGGGVYNLLAGLTACSEHLIRFGGHSAAAGLELDEVALPGFIRDFSAHAAAQLTPDDLRPRVRVDAIADPSQVNLDSIAALEALGPFGAANPEPHVLVPAVRIEQLRKMGDRGQHFKLKAVGRGGRADVVAFGWASAIASGEDAPLVDLVVDLQRNEFRGVVEPQAKLRALGPGVSRPATAWLEEFTRGIDDEVFAGGRDPLDPERAVDRRLDSPLSVIAGLAAQSDGVVLVANDVVEWSAEVAAIAAIDPRVADLPLRCYDDPRLRAEDHRHYVLLDPPPAPVFAGFGDALVTIAWNHSGARIAAGRGPDLLLGRPHMVNAFRAIKDADSPQLERLAESLQNALPSARIAGRAVRAMSELGVVRLDRSGESVEAIHAVETARTELEQSPTFRSYSAYGEDSQRWLRQLTDNQIAQRSP